MKRIKLAIQILMCKHYIVCTSPPDSGRLNIDINMPSYKAGKVQRTISHHIKVKQMYRYYPNAEKFVEDETNGPVE